MKFTSLIVLLCISLTSFSQKSRGDRMLAWQVDVAENGNYDSAFSYAKSVCMESIHLAVNWSSLDTSNGSFDQAFIGGILDVANIYYPAFDVKIELQLATINTVAKETPKDLMGLAFDHPTMISRFKQTLDTLFTHIPDVDLAALNIGNEHDVYMGVDANQYNQYKTFLNAVIPYAKQKYFDLHGKELKVGTTFTLHSLIDDNLKALCQSVNTGLDIVSTTYYPLEDDFTMSPTSAVATDFQDLVDIYSDTSQAIYFAECGYASSDSCNSSEAQQADFYVKVFDAWDLHSDNIKYITIFKSTDWSHDDVQVYKEYYGISDIKFLEYLRTLGVRTFSGNGKSKLAYEQIKCLLKERDWCTVECNLANITSIAPKSVQIYPNPTRGLIHISSDQKVQSVTVYDAFGTLVQTSEGQHIDIKNISTGVYFLNILLEDNSIVAKRILHQSL